MAALPVSLAYLSETLNLLTLIPNHDIGCELSDFSDIFWNEERIGSLMRKVDAVTVATGLVHLPVLADRQGKN